MKTIVAAALALGLAGPLWAAPLQLEPASPQPSGLKPGLSVVYAYPDDVRTLADASRALKEGGAPGAPLEGMDYWDTEEGMNALTSDREMHVVAGISGFVRFDAPGVYAVDFLSNDGLRVEIGGQEVAVMDDRTPCEPGRAVELSVPQAGWYPLEALWFQRVGTSCLHMRAAPAGSDPDWMPNAAFGH
jgi:hypothetical protein